MGDLLTPWHLLIILLIALIVFGPRRLPEMGRSLGDAIREFRSATSGAANSAGSTVHTVAGEAPQKGETPKPEAGEGGAPQATPAKNAGGDEGGSPS